mgnify:CR=1 FL=1
MAFEKRWAEVSVQSLISNGTSDGQLQVANTRTFKVKQLLYLKSNSEPTLIVQVKRVISATTFFVGSPEKDIHHRLDVSAYLTADSASISNPDPHQPRPKIGIEDFARAVYEEEPAVAIRTILVDDLGDKYSASNPLPVQLSDGSISIGTVNAELEVQLSHKDNDPDLGDVHDSVRVGDGVDTLAINPDGSINVVTGGSGGVLVTAYNEVSSVASGVTTDVLTYTVPGTDTYFLSKIEYSGENVATYWVDINGSTVDKQRTYFGGALNGSFHFSDGTSGLAVSAGDMIKLRVVHQRPMVGDFNARIQLTQL